MKVFVKFDYQVVCKRVLEAQLEALQIPYKLNGIGEIELASDLKQDKKEALTEGLAFYGIQIIQDDYDFFCIRIKCLKSLHKTGKFFFTSLASNLYEPLSC